jgi:hypothetical protein
MVAREGSVILIAQREAAETVRWILSCYRCFHARWFVAADCYPEAAVGDRQQRLRVVRHLPVCVELSKPGEAWGQVLDKPPGRKPRGRAATDQQSRGSMGIRTLVEAREAQIVGAA